GERGCRGAGSGQVSLAEAAYRAAGVVLRPALEAWARAGGAERRARAGLVAAEPAGALWVHAASVGELGGVEAFLAALAARRPGLPARLTLHTRTGLARARAAGRVAELAPVDAAFAVRRRLARTRPAAVVVFETELWPALLEEAGGRVPLSWVNGRISPRAFARYAAGRALLRGGLAAVRAFAVQTGADAERFVALGAPPERVLVAGNLKHDRPAPAPLARAALGLAADGPVAVLGSLREGEEEAVLAALAEARHALPQLVAVLAPRHPREAARLAQGLAARGVPFGRRTQGAVEARTLLLDSVGELAAAYTLAEVAFVGGSLAPRGGHDVMEPARAGCPVLFGPHTQHCAADCEALLAAGAAVRVADARGLGRELAALPAEPARRTAMGAAAREVAGRSRGAAARALDWLERHGALPGAAPAGEGPG
ncbi:MAG TPA: glycosyltransferase N-terminal domain-containing protein, partial [Candidatus Saccharimonadales bacterium]|nr:glycosyltransferase N-terminal domain-containing protein [Candidatus Saccharimonadales bacterium]